jgi:hypothetical protein
MLAFIAIPATLLLVLVIFIAVDSALNALCGVPFEEWLIYALIIE